MLFTETRYQQHQEIVPGEPTYQSTQRQERIRLGATYTVDTDRARDQSRSRPYDYSPKRGMPRHQPKNLGYDGSTNWLSFKQKFESYRAVNRWSDSECRDYLNWCLEGKALDYFTIETSMGEWLSYTDIILKKERRFGTKELPELSKVTFHQAIQGQQESLEEWTDRVLTLATPAFRNIPEQYKREEIVSKFCQGCMDNEAGKHACLQRHKSIQEAIDLVRHHQYITHAVEGNKVPRGRAVNLVNSSNEDKMAAFEKMLNSLSSQIEKLTKPTPLREKSSPKKTFSGTCFFCR
ncbi:hypothetical protein DPMN_080706 [Dreissena polymorpha]|uniref:Fibrillar collagen NC1 domain-containing protein n=1 Tax=Dreissena polymorpha TaxID=45954 RepID=A0A9D3YRD7_DREPO|nr:hypothetical protein DPMN_080706 [Dreissena polymorpha]